MQARLVSLESILNTAKLIRVAETIASRRFYVLTPPRPVTTNEVCSAKIVRKLKGDDSYKSSRQVRTVELIL